MKHSFIRKMCHMFFDEVGEIANTDRRGSSFFMVYNHSTGTGQPKGQGIAMVRKKKHEG